MPSTFAEFFIGNHFDEAAVIAKDGGFAVTELETCDLLQH